MNGYMLRLSSNASSFKLHCSLFFFFFNDPATTEIYTLSLHDALPICRCGHIEAVHGEVLHRVRGVTVKSLDRKSTRLNSSHVAISYAVFCLKKKTNSASRPAVQTRTDTPPDRTPAPPA